MKVRQFRPRTTEEAREALSRFCNRRAVMTIPVDNERDADCILSDVITERDYLRDHETKTRAVVEAAQTCDALWQLEMTDASGVAFAMALERLQVALAALAALDADAGRGEGT